jgi:hypothetical protein
VHDDKVSHPAAAAAAAVCTYITSTADIASTGDKYAAVQGLKAYLADLAECHLACTLMQLTNCATASYIAACAVRS